MLLVSRILNTLDRPVVFRRAMLVLVFLLFAWCCGVTAIVDKSQEALVSSGRLLVETLLVLTLSFFAKERFWGFFLKSLIAVSTISSLVVIFQLLEGIGCFPRFFTHIITDFWHLANEGSRKPGLFNGFLTSSLLAFLSLVLLSGRKDRWSVILMTLNLFPIGFGSRTVLVFLPVFLALNRRVLVGGAVALAILTFVGSSCGFFQMLEQHVEERIVPTARVVINANPNLDYSSLDLMTHYKEPDNGLEWLIGNGEPRYSEHGGKDPAVSRWLLQAGLPAAALIVLISALLCYRIARKPGWVNLLFVLVLALATFKSELITSTLIFSVLMLYALSDYALPRRPEDHWPPELKPAE